MAAACSSVIAVFRVDRHAAPARRCPEALPHTVLRRCLSMRRCLTSNTDYTPRAQYQEALLLHMAAACSSIVAVF
jgi:hypothetical protein